MATPGNILVNLSFVSTKPTGLANYALNLVPELALPNLTLLSPIDRSQFLPHNQPDANLHPIPHNLNPEYGKAGHFRRLKWTQFELPKIYQADRSPLLFSLVPEAPLFTKTRSIVVVHDLIPLRFPHWKSPLTYYFRYYIPQVLEQAEHIICNSIATAQDVSDYFKTPAKKLTAIPLAYDQQNFKFLNLTPKTNSPQKPYFFYVGRHDPYKNLQRLISAFAALPNSQDYELWIAGAADRRYTPTLELQATELGVSDRVKFLNYVSYSELPIILNQAIALVFPSLWEGFGFPALEAMACGTPVITSNLSSLPEVVGDAAILVNPYDERELTAAMQQVAEDKAGLRSHLQQAGLNQAKQFSWTQTGALTKETLLRFL